MSVVDEISSQGAYVGPDEEMSRILRQTQH